MSLFIILCPKIHLNFLMDNLEKMRQFLMICFLSSAYLCCTKCRYSSCCAQALKIHTSLFHGPRAPFYNLGHPSILKENVFCVCGFNTNSGNKIGKLLLKVCLFSEDSQFLVRKHF